MARPIHAPAVVLVIFLCGIKVDPNFKDPRTPLTVSGPRQTSDNMRIYFVAVLLTKVS